MAFPETTPNGGTGDACPSTPIPWWSLGSRRYGYAPGRRGRLIRVLIVAAWLVMAIALQSVLSPVPAAAHTGFAGSEPADGDQLSEPVGEVVITFTGEAEPTGEGFVALDPLRGVRAPDEVVARSESQWLLRFDPPLSGGEVAIRWTVKAPDAHAISGGFSFTVTAEAVSQSDEPDPTPDVTDQVGSEPETGAVSGNTPTEKNTPVSEVVSGVVGPDEAADFAAATTERLENAQLVANLGRGLAYAGAVLAIGALVFAVFVLDRPDDIVAVVRWAGTCGLVVVCGAALEMVAQMYVEYGRWSVSNLLDMADTELGYSAGLRAVGGAFLWALPTPKLTWRPDVRRAPAVWAGSQPAMQPVPAPMPAGQPGSPSAVSTKTVIPDGAEAVVDAPAGASVAWRSGSAAVVAIIASVMLATSHIFDGHTLSQGNRIVMSLAAISHVAAAGAWAGGVVALALTVLRRRRRPPVNSAELGARFSVVAAVGLVVVGVAGVALTAMIVDSPSQLWTTDWGRLLLVKVALVVVGAVLGGYNHFVLLPRMGARATAAGRTAPLPRIGFSTVLAIEAGLLISVAVLSGVLAGAAL